MLAAIEKSGLGRRLKDVVKIVQLNKGVDAKILDVKASYEEEIRKIRLMKEKAKFSEVVTTILKPATNEEIKDFNTKKRNRDTVEDEDVDEYIDTETGTTMKKLRNGKFRPVESLFIDSDDSESSSAKSDDKNFISGEYFTNDSDSDSGNYEIKY